MTDKLLRIDQVSDKIGVSRATIYRLQKGGDFPRSTKVHGKCVAWSEAEIDDWIKSRLMMRKPALSFR